MFAVIKKKEEKKETELTASVLKKDPKTHKRLQRMFFYQTNQDRIRFYEKILFFKAKYNRETNKQFTYLLPVRFFQKGRGHKTDVLK